MKSKKDQSQKFSGGPKVLKYNGSAYLRQRLVLSTLSGIPTSITEIRVGDTDPGLRDYEVTFLRLLEKITDGGKVVIDETGTRLSFHPGIITGGARPSGALGADTTIRFQCGTSRCLTYFLEPLMMLAPFSKRAISMRLTGITNSSFPDPSIETFRTVALPFLKFVGISDGLVLQVIQRGLFPVGGGEVLFECPQLRKLQPFDIMRSGRVKRVRGVAFTHGVSQQFAVRCIDKARMVLNNFIPDVWIYTDSSTTKRKKLIHSPTNIQGAEGFGISLVAETMKGVYKGADMCFDKPLQALVSLLEAQGQAQTKAVPLDAVSDLQIDEYRCSTARCLTRFNSSSHSEVKKNETETSDLLQSFTFAERIGYVVATRLISEIHIDGVVDSVYQHLPLFFMALAEQYKTSKVVLGRLTPQTVQFLRHIKDFLNVEFQLSEYRSPTLDEEAIDGTDESEGYDSNKCLGPSPMILASCLGIGYLNIARKSF